MGNKKVNHDEAVIGLRSLEDLESHYGRSMAMMAMDLRLPVIVSEILNGKQSYDSTIQSHIEDTILDMDVYSAILALTLASKLLILRYAFGDEDFEPDRHILLYKDNLEVIIARYAPAWLENALQMEELVNKAEDEDEQDQSVYAALNADFRALAVIIETLEEGLKPVCLDASRLAENLHHISEYFISETDGEVDDFCRKIAQSVGAIKLS